MSNRTVVTEPATSLKSAREARASMLIKLMDEDYSYLKLTLDLWEAACFLRLTGFRRMNFYDARTGTQMEAFVSDDDAVTITRAW